LHSRGAVRAPRDPRPTPSEGTVIARVATKRISPPTLTLAVLGGGEQ
jgi:hypothetical protein